MSYNELYYYTLLGYYYNNKDVKDIIKNICKHIKKEIK